MRTLLIAALLAATPAAAQNASFHPGPVLPDVAPVATIASDMTVAAGTVFRVTYDVTVPAIPGAANRSFETAARFLNSHVEAGVAESDINIAYVVHGKAILDLLSQAAYAARFDGKPNPTAALVARLLAHRVNF